VLTPCVVGLNRVGKTEWTHLLRYVLPRAVFRLVPALERSFYFGLYFLAEGRDELDVHVRFEEGGCDLFEHGVEHL
jgi:hypothetical protein